MITIYCLRDPDTAAIRYVGQTSASLQDRLAGHLGDNGARPCAVWVRSLTQAGKVPLIEPLEVVPATMALERESWWVGEHRRQGALLLNEKPGRKAGEHKLYPRQHAVRFTEAGWTALRDLAARWGVSEAEAVRRLVDAAAKDSSPDSVSGP